MEVCVCRYLNDFNADRRANKKENCVSSLENDESAHFAPFSGPFFPAMNKSL